MVQSKINKNVEYKDTKEIEKEDDDLEVNTYDLKFKKYDKINDYTVAFGKVNHKYENKGIVFYPMYLITDDEVNCQIGIFEIKIEKLPSIVDDDGDIDPKYIKSPLLYSFVNKDFLTSFVKEDELSDDENDEKEEEFVEEVTEDDLGITNIDDVLSVTVPKNPVYTKNREESIFEIDINQKQPETLAEETKQDANEIKKKFKSSPKNEWIENFMQNNEYTLIDNEGGGDCLFAVIRDAFEQIGKYTTIARLRDIVAEETTHEIFQENLKVYLDIENAINETEKAILKSIGSYKEYQKRIKDSDLKESERKEILNESKTIKDKIKMLKGEKSLSKEMLDEDFGYMRDINNLAKYQDFIRTSEFWADAWAISVLEYKLNIKLIILSEKSFNEDALDSVLNCGDFNLKMQKKGAFNPSHYIITSYSGFHYKLISYKGKKIFSYREIPYDIKNLIVNKCLERNAGPYNIIEDFRNLKKKLGVDNEDSDSDDEETTNRDLFVNDTVFLFHNKSQIKNGPGKGSGEKIPKEKIPEFKKLTKIENWRRKLDDLYNTPFDLDNHKWKTVEHYYQGSKYKKGYPDYYLNFSLDSESDISEDIELAKKKGSKSGQDGKVKIDPDFYGERSVQEKESAIFAKFDQHENLKNMLIQTYPAKLMHFERGKKPTLAKELLKIRKRFIDEK